MIGNPFSLSIDSTVSDAVLAMRTRSGANSPVNVYIESDNAGSPGSVLASLTQVGTIPTAPGGLVTFSCNDGAGCALQAGSYWLVAYNSDPETLQGWFFAFDDRTTIIANSEVGSVSGMYTHPGTEAGFEIDGTTPEPSSFLLLGSGLAGLAGLIKRKLKA